MTCAGRPPGPPGPGARAEHLAGRRAAAPAPARRPAADPRDGGGRSRGRGPGGRRGAGSGRAGGGPGPPLPGTGPAAGRRDGSGLIRTWAARGTVHLIDPADWPWLHAALGTRNRARFDAAMRQRGDYDAAAGMLDDLVAVLRERPLDRAGLLGELAARGHPGLGQRSVNVLMPWAAAQGLVAGLPGRPVPGGRAAAGGRRRTGAGHAGPPLPAWGRPARRTWRPGPASRLAPPAGRWPPWAHRGGGRPARPARHPGRGPAARAARLAARRLRHHHARLPQPRTAGRRRGRPPHPAGRRHAAPGRPDRRPRRRDLVGDRRGPACWVAIDWFRAPASPPELHAEQLSVETFLQDASSPC